MDEECVAETDLRCSRLPEMRNIATVGASAQTSDCTPAVQAQAPGARSLWARRISVTGQSGKRQSFGGTVATLFRAPAARHGCVEAGSPEHVHTLRSLAERRGVEVHGATSLGRSPAERPGP